MTSRYPFRYGLQKCIPPGSTAAIPTSVPVLPELLAASEANYTTVALGKWHLGMAAPRNTPLGRGFGRHLGYFQGEQDYFTKRVCSSICVLANASVGHCGFDFFAAGAPDPPNHNTAASNYSSWLYRDEAVATIEALGPGSPPLFMYLGWQAAHVPLQPPPEPEYMARRCGHVGDPRRQIYCAMITALVRRH